MTTKFRTRLKVFFPRTLRPHFILSGRLRGCRIVTSWHDYPAAILGITEPRLLDWFYGAVNPGETWLDVGAHYGYTAFALSRRVGPTGRVFAFEPMLATAGCIARSRSLNHFRQLEVVPIALGASAMLESISLPTIRGMIDSTLGARAASDPGAQGWDETLLTARLDWLWPQINKGNGRIDGIKVDVQGMEIEVIKGMLPLLQVHRPKLVVELHRGVDRKTLLDLLRGVGYVEPGRPVEPVAGEIEPQYLDDRSYAFAALPPA